MGNYIVGTIVLLLLAIAVRSAVIRGKAGCCSGEGCRMIVKIKVRDTDASHYPYKVRLLIDGMTCGNCAVKVENALNAMDGVWAKVKLNENCADVLLKNKSDARVLCRAVNDLGMYTAMKSEWL